MRALPRFGVRNPTAVNMATLAICLAGWLMYSSMPREVFPDFSLGTVQVTTLYPGAAPEDVERLVTLPIEDELEAIDGLKELVSVSRQGLSTIDLTVNQDREMTEFLADVRSAIDRVVELPGEVEDPFVREVVQEWPVISVFVYGSLSEVDIRKVAEEHQRELEDLDGVSSVDIAGLRDLELWVEVNPEALERYALTLEQVEGLVAARVRELPLGTLSTSGGDYLLRVESGVEFASELVDLPVITLPDGGTVRLGAVARVVDTFERPVTLARFNGQPSLHLQVNKDSRGDAIDIAELVHEYVATEMPKQLPGLGLGTNSDLSIYIQNRLNVMRESATIGGLLVMLSLLSFLSARVALITALGIPVSFLGGIALAGAFGISMNMMTMFALIIVLGMIVDDAIVVAENCYRRMEEGDDPETAAIEGTAEVARPVMATILTTIAAFLPILMISGTMGQFLRPLPLIVSFCLITSLGEALFVLPAHIAHWTGRRRSQLGAAVLSSGSSGATDLATAERALESRPEKQHWYQPVLEAYTRLLRRCLRWRYITLSGALAVTSILVAFAVWWIPFHLFDEFESKIFSINMRMPPGSSLEETSARAAQVEQWIIGLPDEEVESSHILVGLTAIDSSRWTFGENLAQIWVELREGEGRTRATAEIIEAVREEWSPPPIGIESIEVSQPQGGPTGRAIDISVQGPDLAVLEEISKRFQESLRDKVGVRDVHDDAENGKRQVTVELTESGRTLGFSELQLARQLRTAFAGTEVARLRRGADEVEVVVKLPEELRSNRQAIENLRVNTPTGARVPLRAVAQLTETRGPALIGRSEGERAVHVFADINKELNSSNAVIAEIDAEFTGLSEQFPGYRYAFEGDQEELEESFQGLIGSLAIAMAAIFVILGTLFRSWSQPMVIMLAIPFGATGMILGHAVMGRDLSFLSLIGLLALSGIVVNDSLILVDFINQKRAHGMELFEAMIISGRQRFRPILLTSITTMLGLSPLTFFATGQARFLQPMAISLFFGLLVATGLILLLVPCGYLVLEDVLALLKRPFQRSQEQSRNSTPELPRPEPVA